MFHVEQVIGGVTGTHLYNKYPPESDFGGIKVLNLGCGFAKLKNATNVDAFGNCEPEVIWDLEKTPLPFPDESFDFIIANHIFEHIENWWEVFIECGRILKPNGKLEIWVPGNGADSIFGYRDHLKMINYCSFFGSFQTFREGGNAWAEANSRSWANRLKLVSQGTRVEDLWWMKLFVKFFKPAALWCSNHLRNVVREQQFLFRKVTEEEFVRGHNREALRVL